MLYEQLIAYFTLALVSVTVVYAVISIGLWRETRRTLRVDIVFRYMEYFLQSVGYELESNMEELVEAAMKEPDEQVEKLIAELKSKGKLDRNDAARIVKEVKERNRKQFKSRIKTHVLFNFMWGSKNSIVNVTKELDEKLGKDIEILADKFEETLKEKLNKHKKSA